MAKSTKGTTPPPRLRPKQIVYLFGAGATYAEVRYRNAANVNTLMRDIGSLEGVATRILKQLPSSMFGVDGDLDIEKAISLLTASGVGSHLQRAEEMRRLYFEDIRKSLIAAKILRQPKLAMGLLEMHNNPSFSSGVESLSAIITTNHDGLLQVASEKVLKAVNIGFPFESEDLTPANSKTLPPILQLHGSLTWRFAVPLKVSRLDATPRKLYDTMWIPPTIQKESKNYPFNKLNALAYEVLSERCDVLRVVGSSLTQNDWNILSLLFNAQRHRDRARKSSFGIELIMSQKGGLSIKTSCSYLKNALVIGSLSDGHFAEFKNFENRDPPAGSVWTNPFFFWLREKINFHLREGHFGSAGIESTMKEVAEK
ncbi:MAG: hypothetical protein ABI923_01405 [bacterium]